MHKKCALEELADLPIYTTTQAARVCHVSVKTMVRCMDNGDIACFRVPGSKDRRVTRDDLLRFLQRHNMPRVWLQGRQNHVILLAGLEPELEESLRTWFPAASGFLFVAAATPFVAGGLVVRLEPHLLVVDSVGLGRREAVGVGQALRQVSRPGTVRALALVGEDEHDDYRAFGYDAWLPRPLDLLAVRTTLGLLLQVSLPAGPDLPAAAATFLSGE